MSNAEKQCSRYSDTLPDQKRWPHTRRALVLWTQEHLDRELDRMPRSEWFDVVLAAHLEDLGEQHDREFRAQLAEESQP